jgi:hypothetical protein
MEQNGLCALAEAGDRIPAPNGGVHVNFLSLELRFRRVSVNSKRCRLCCSSGPVFSPMTCEAMPHQKRQRMLIEIPRIHRRSSQPFRPIEQPQISSKSQHIIIRWLSTEKANSSSASPDPNMSKKSGGSARNSQACSSGTTPHGRARPQSRNRSSLPHFSRCCRSHGTHSTWPSEDSCPLLLTPCTKPSKGLNKINQQRI